MGDATPAAAIGPVGVGADMSAAPDTVRKQMAAAELLRRRRCRDSLHSYALSIDIPTAPMKAMCPDEALTGPAALLMAKHHSAILTTLQRTVTRPFGRCIIMAPPGSAKSLYASVVMPTWVMGRTPGSRIMLTSYASKLAERQANRAQQIVQQEKYRQLWPEEPTLTKDAAGDWFLSNESNMLSMGLTAGLTGNRASGWIIDDPVAGREEADSPTEQQNIVDAYQDDLLSRCVPGAWGVLIMTRWNENDLAGKILPDDYKGQSGMIRCKDGLLWEVLNIPAKAEMADDPLGRAYGEYLWPEYMPVQHWQMYELAQGAEAARSWASLYQQRPTAQGSGRFTREMFQLYDADELPVYLTMVGASDHAVSENKNDFSEAGVFGMDANGHLWAVDWWYKQTGDAGEAIQEILDRVARWKARMWFNEGGVIDKAISGPFNRRTREMMSPGKHFCANDEGELVLCHRAHDVYTDRRALPSMKDKVAKCMAFQARCAIGTVHFPRNAPWRERVIQQLTSLPAGRHDDAADVCGLIGRAVDQYHPARPPEPKVETIIRPFTEAWLLSGDKPDVPEVRWR